ncbi:MAG: cell surface receptor domain protein, partial [Deltaproteobacteria bacterium]|nr:cell surface receptor domain protein [Deltaproteobacteria bacterium]
MERLEDRRGPGSKEIIEAQIPGQNGVTLTYPYGSFTPSAAVESYAESIYIGSKTVKAGSTCSLNGGTFDFGKLVGCSYDDGHANVFAGADAAEAQGKWVDVSTHTVNGGADGCYGEWTTSNLTDFLDYLQTKDVYVGTFGALVKYARERVNATLSVVSSTATQIVLRLTDTLDNNLYDQPLTLRIETPSDWGSATVQQGGSSIQTATALESGTRVIYYDTVPDQGNITLTVQEYAFQVSGISPQTVSSGSAGFTLQVSGSGFVSGAAVRLNGSARTTTFVSSALLRAEVLAADVAEGGSISVTVRNPNGSVSNATTLTVAQFQVSGISPQAVSAGSAGFTLEVSGSGFVSGAAVRLNGSARTTTFVSSALLRAEVLAADVAEAGSISVTVRNPDSSVSNASTLTVAQFQVSGISPQAVAAGSSPFTLEVSGSGFMSGAAVRLNGSNRTTTFVSSALLRA